MSAAIRLSTPKSVSESHLVRPPASVFPFRSRCHGEVRHVTLSFSFVYSFVLPCRHCRIGSVPPQHRLGGRGISARFARRTQDGERTASAGSPRHPPLSPSQPGC